MSVSQSNLSDPKYGYDLVVAITQASVNATMLQYLAGVTAPEVISCWVYDSNNNLVSIDYATLKANANGSDPFSVTDGSDPYTNQDLINLTAANFAGAVKATIGIPAVAPSSLPPIVTLGGGTSAPVLFNLLCSEFVITGFSYGSRGKALWINLAQPTSEPLWYFSANVYLNNTTLDPNSPVPPAVQQRIQELISSVGPDAFSIQQLFLDLDTAILESSPAIEGIPPGWAVWVLVNTVFMEAYFGQLQQSGQPVLGYSFTATNPTPTTMQLGALAHECCPLLDGNGQPIPTPTPAQQEAATFVYVGTAATPPPSAVPFAWNWMELADVTSFSGVQAVRRDIFLNFFAGLLNSNIGPLSQNTNVSLTHDDETYYVDYSSSSSPNPSSFQPISPVGPPASDGFTDVMSLNFSIPSHDDSEDSLHTTSIHGDFNYTLTGTVAVNGNQIRVCVTATSYMSFYHHELGIDYNDLPGANYYDKTQTVLYELAVGQSGNLAVTQTNNLVDNSATWNFTPAGLVGKLGLESDVKSGLTSLQSDLQNYLDSAFTDYAQNVTDEINGYHGWVFPGANAFVISNLLFSSGQDLVSQLVYANPN